MEISDKNLKNAILTSLADEEIVKILNSTKKEAKSAIELMKIHDISHSTAYRKIKWLLDNRLLVVEKIEITPDGKKFSMLKNTLKSVQITYDEKVTVQIKENENGIKLSAKQFLSLE